MQTTQKQSESLKSDEQSSCLNADERLNVESAFGESQELFGVLENGFLKNQQLIAALTVTVISVLVVLAVIQISNHTIGQQFGNNIYSVNKLGLATLTGVAIGLMNWVLGQISTNQLKSSLAHLQTQCQVLKTRLVEAEQKAELAEDENKELQDKMSKIIQNVDLSYSDDLTPETDFSSREEEAIEPPGTLLDFLDNLHNWFKVTTTPEQFLGSSTLEEVQQRKEELQYRQVWLQALEEETNRELQLLTVICQSSEQT